jgi:hypothetical protein
MFSVYVLESGKTGRRYVGSRADLTERLNDTMPASRLRQAWIAVDYDF